MYRYVLFIVVSMLLTVSHSQAETSVEQERARLASLQQSLSRQQNELRELLSELNAYPPRLSEAEEAVLRAEQEVANLKRDLAEMQRQAAIEETLQLSREIPLKEHAISMAERRVRSENRMLERYRRYYDNLREDVAKNERDIAQLNRRIADQQQRLAAAEAQGAGNQESLAHSAPPASTQTPPPAARISAPAAAPRTVSQAATPAVDAPSQQDLPPLSAADREALALADATMSRVEELIALNPNSSPRFSNLQLTSSDMPAVPFEHLGADQYRAEVVLPSGLHRFRIDNLRFRVQISAADAGETFVFIVDASERQRPKAFYFKKAVLAYRGQNTAVAQRVEAPQAAPALEQVKLASGQTVELNEDDAFALEIARDHLSLLTDLNLSLDQRQSSNRYSLSGNLVENTSMQHLGQDHYLAEVTVQSGRQSIRINRSSFRIEVPSADEGEVYLFFIDAGRPSRLQMTYFKKSLLQYL